MSEQVAERQGKYLAQLLNRIGKAGGGRENGAKDMDFGEPFVYRHMGSMASVGRHKALVDLRQSKVRASSSFFLFFKYLRLKLIHNSVLNNSNYAAKSLLHNGIFGYQHTVNAVIYYLNVLISLLWPSQTVTGYCGAFVTSVS